MQAANLSCEMGQCGSGKRILYTRSTYQESSSFGRGTLSTRIMEPQACFIASSHDHAGIFVLHKAQPSPNVQGHHRLLHTLLPMISIVVIIAVATKF